MSICSAERHDVTSAGCQLAGKCISNAWQSSANCLVNAGTDMQTSPLQPDDNPPKKPGKNRQKLFGARSGFWGLQPIMSSLYKRALGVRAPRVVFLPGHNRLMRCYSGRVAQLVEQVTFNHWVTGSNPVALTIAPASASAFPRAS